ncbi:MAG TPA: hypothetical protein VEZ55_08660 [Chitinophagaceae bacterium]|nr:hypothetical protein [Chitinophagaceae bacterium]
MVTSRLRRIVYTAFIAFFLLCMNSFVEAQCSICTKTAAQLGEKPAKGLNAGIIYLALTPFAVVGLIGYRWWKRERQITG